MNVQNRDRDPYPNTLLHRIFLAKNAPWENWDAIDGYVDCKTLEEHLIKRWGYALAGVRCWSKSFLGGWSSNDHLRDRVPDARYMGVSREFVEAVLAWRDRDLALQRQCDESEDRIKDLVTEALNTVYQQLGEHEAMGERAMVAAVCSAAEEYVRQCFDNAGEGRPAHAWRNLR